MRGEQRKSESLFAYLRLEERIAVDHGSDIGVPNTFGGTREI